MVENNINWTYGENESQKYYDAYVGKDYLCVFEDGWNPGVWMGNVRDNVIRDKATKNVLRGADPAAMMEAVAWCYKNKTIEAF